ncbi:hypothetical protein [Enterobacter asburiae]|uniref:phage tail fiber protein n=1 Tax=Enterobacter asburiae TaxID=61645 RepID=UPI00079A21A1|nr:hypothetical protein [Enterobacter asburiae]SAE96726.1 Uncharacterised protein [Enterobacter cloacae]
MIYTTGTIAISGNTLTGTGTNFTAAGSLIRNGCSVIALTNPAQVFQITAIGSATSLTVTPAANPAVPSGTKYAILLSDSLSVDGLAQDIAETFTMYQRYMSGFADVMNGTTDVTITINGVAVTVPGQKSLAKKGANSDITSLSGLTTALSISQGGTGDKTAAGARTNLGLGNSATKDTGEGDNNVLVSGAFGLGSKNLPVIGDIWDKSQGTRFCNVNPATSGGPGMYGSGIRLSDRNIGSGATSAAQQSFSSLILSGKIIQFMSMADGVDSGWMQIYHTGNTTRAADGSLKGASPIVQLFGSGACQLNDESEGCAVTRLGIGEYLIEGCTGLNADAAWGGIDGGFDIPTDRNKQPLIWLDYKVNSDGSVLVKTYHRTHLSAPEFARNELAGLADGDPVDIPSDQFVSVRVEMPANSIWNQKQLAAKKALDDAHELEANKESGS